MRLPILLLAAGLAAALVRGADTASSPEETGTAVSADARATLEAFGRKDYRTAAKAARAGAERGDPDCLLMLARLTENGWGVERDAAGAFALFEKAAAAGSPEAGYHLARCTENGIGTRADPEKADFLWQQSAEAGFAAAQNRLGRMELEGVRRPRNTTAAREWFEKAAAQHEPDSLYRLGMARLNGQAGLEKDLAKGVALIIEAANRGSIDAINQMGMCYQFGVGVPLDKVAAAGWFRFAAEYDLPAALANIGQCYETGQGVKPDLETAVRYFRAAAAKDDTVGLLYLGRCYKDGRGMPADKAMAWACFARAADLGLTAAEKLRDESAAGLTPDARTAAAARLAGKPAK